MGVVLEILTLNLTAQIYTPQGSGIWYGRVQSHHVDAIVSETLEEGKILPELLRGGLNISTKRKSLLEW